MLTIFGSSSGGGGIFNNSLVILIGIFLVVFVFLKFCGWAKGFSLSGGVKKLVFILTGLGLIAFNVLYSLGNSSIQQGHGWGMASYALLGSLVWIFIFGFVLMAETKSE